MNRLAAATILSMVILSPWLQQTTVAAGPPYSWSGPAAVDQSFGLDLLPAALQASNGTLWLAWQTYRYSGGSRPDIVYKTMTGGIWSSSTRFTSTGTNITPSFAQLNNGTILLLWALRTTGSFNIYYKRYSVDQFGVGAWSSSVQITNTNLNDTSPSAAVGADGRLWLFWQRSNTTCNPDCSETRQLYYKFLTNGVWSADTALTSDANWNWAPSAVVGKDGKVRVVWSKGQNTLNNHQIYHTAYDGTAWSLAAQVVFSASADEHASILQDRNGTIWLFWARQFSTQNTFYYILYNKYSVNNGQTWSAEAQMSFEPSEVTSQTPAAVQTNSGPDKTLRVFFATDRAGDFDIWVYASPSISPVHDVRIVFVSPSTPLQYPGGLASVGMGPIVTISVTVSNVGDSSETVQLTVTMSNATSYNLGTQTGSIGLGGSLTLSFNWDTTGVPAARYSLDVSAVPASGETAGNAADSHVFQKSRVHIIPLGDLDQNGAVSLTDVSVFFYDFGFSSTCGCSRWNPFADINNTGIIDIIDVGVAVMNFGITT